MSTASRSSLTPLIRLGAWGAIIGGGLRAVATFVPYAADSARLEALYGVIDVGLLFGLIAIYLDGAAAGGRAALTGFSIALIGMASIVGPDAQAFGIDFYLAGSLVLLVGLSILAAAFWRAGWSRLPAQAWLLATLLAILGGVSAQPLLIGAGGLVLGLGFVLAGAQILQRFAPISS
jgi:hypothetical protein